MNLRNYTRVETWLDLPGFVDYMLVNFYVGNDDWPIRNWYAGRRRADNEPFRFFSWDAEHVLKDPYQNRTAVNRGNTPGGIYHQLRKGTEFRQLFADRIQRLFFHGGPLAAHSCDVAPVIQDCETSVAGETYMRRIREIDSAVALEAARWGDSRREEPYTREKEWLAELHRLTSQYFSQRSFVVLNQLRLAGLFPSVEAPIFSQRGGEVEPGSTVTLSLPEGTVGEIFYTTDGEDPRVIISGDVSPTALRHLAPLWITVPTIVRARVRSGSVWSPLDEAVFTVPTAFEGLRLTEIMYHPTRGKEFEYLELQNTSAFEVDLSGVTFSKGVQFTFPAGTFLRSGAFAVLVSNADSFAALYPNVVPMGVFTGALDNSGERLTLQDSLENVIFSVEYEDDEGWPVAADGIRYSLVPTLNGEDYDDPTSWRASAEPLGSPGREDPTPPDGGVVINEILSRSTTPLEDAIELHNLTDETVDVSGWFLSDRRSPFEALFKYSLPEGSILPPGGFLVFYENQFNASPGSAGNFALSGSGEEVFLSSTSGPGGAFTGYVTSLCYDALEEGQAFGRYLTSRGADSTTLQTRTFGSDDPTTVEEFRTGTGGENAAPAVGPLVIHELHYHPTDNDAEFLEIYNTSGDEVSLNDPDGGGGWKVDGLSPRGGGGGDFTFPAEARLAPFGFALLVPTPPEFFRVRYSVPDDVMIYGPYGGALNNGGEEIELLKPFALQDGDLDFVVVDHVNYSDELPWPQESAGEGASLERRDALGYGNEPENWGASEVLAGTPGQHNSIGPQPPNMPPVAVFSVSPSLSSVSLTVAFDASESMDPDGSVVEHVWDFGDGTSGTGPEFSHTYFAPGLQEVVLRVTDNLGRSAEASETLIVGELADANLSPLPFFTLVLESGSSFESVELDAFASRDPDGEIMQYVWEFSDGATAEGQVAFHTFEGEGPFEVALTVEDDRGAFSTLTRPVIATTFDDGLQVPGDCNQDGVVDLSDAICFFGVLFLGRPESFPCGEHASDPGNLSLLDWTNGGELDLSAGVAMLQFLFAAGEPHHALTGVVERESCLPMIGCPESDACQ